MTLISRRALIFLTPLLFVVALMGWAHDPLAVEPANQLASPSWAHPFGTDLLGRDVVSRFLQGGLRTLLVAGSATLIAIASAVALRLACLSIGKFGMALIKMLDQALLAIPGLAVALTVTTLAGNGETGVIAATSISQIAPFLRVLLVAESQARLTGYVEASQAIGGTGAHIWRSHLAPTMLPVLLAYAGVVFAQAVLMSAALNFLGFGGEISAPEWGRMLYEGRQVMRVAPWVAIAPGLGITLLVLWVNQVLRLLNRK